MHENKLFGILSSDAKSKTFEATSKKPASKESKVKVQRKAKVRHKASISIEKKVLVGLFVSIGFILWCLYIIFRNPSQTLKDILSFFKSVK